MRHFLSFFSSFSFLQFAALTVCFNVSDSLGELRKKGGVGELLQLFS